MASLEDLLAAVRDDQADAVREIVSKQPELIGKRTETGSTAVLMAAYCGADAALGVLLANDPELDGCEAAALGDDDRLRQLADTDPQQVLGLGADGWTPLHLAGFMGHESTLRLLLGLGAEVDLLSANDTCNTPLHAALAGRPSVGIVEALLAAGAPIDATGEGGITPLHVAAARGDIELIELLVERGAHAVAMEDGKTPADLAEDREHAKAAAMLRALTG